MHQPVPYPRNVQGFLLLEGFHGLAGHISRIAETALIRYHQTRGGNPPRLRRGVLVYEGLNVKTFTPVPLISPLTASLRLCMNSLEAPYVAW